MDIFWDETEAILHVLIKGRIDGYFIGPTEDWYYGAPVIAVGHKELTIPQEGIPHGEFHEKILRYLVTSQRNEVIPSLDCHEIVYQKNFTSHAGFTDFGRTFRRPNLNDLKLHKTPSGVLGATLTFGKEREEPFSHSARPPFTILYDPEKRTWFPDVPPGSQLVTIPDSPRDPDVLWAFENARSTLLADSTDYEKRCKELAKAVHGDFSAWPPMNQMRPPRTADPILTRPLGASSSSGSTPNRSSPTEPALLPNREVDSEGNARSDAEPIVDIGNILRNPGLLVESEGLDALAEKSNYGIPDNIAVPAQPGGSSKQTVDAEYKEIDHNEALLAIFMAALIVVGSVIVAVIRKSKTAS